MNFAARGLYNRRCGALDGRDVAVLGAERHDVAIRGRRAHGGEEKTNFEQRHGGVLVGAAACGPRAYFLAVGEKPVAEKRDASARRLRCAFFFNESLELTSMLRRALRPRRSPAAPRRRRWRAT